MKISKVRISNFRCLDDLTLQLEDISVFIGANSTGKSSVLHALAWFFEGGELDLEDVGGGADCQELRDEDRIVSVSVTFKSLNPTDKDVFGSYVVDGKLTLWRTWTPGQSDKLTGRGLAFPPFNEIRACSSASDKNRAYKDLKQAQPGLKLPNTRSAAQVDEALEEWEAQNPDKLEATEVEATHLFGFVGGARLRGRFDFVLVPATSDPEAQARDAPRTLLRQLVERTGASDTINQRLKGIEQEVTASVQEIIEEEGSQPLDELSMQVTNELVRLIPGGQVKLEPKPSSFTIPAPGVELRVADGGVETSVSRQGHGFQRALLIALIQQLAVPREAKDPPGLFLAIEEPELYQHPLQARHFAKTLEKLAREEGSSVQIAYATHSEHFIDASHFERLRRFSRHVWKRDWPTAKVTQATFSRVADRLTEIFDSDQITLRVKLTLRRQLAEAIFARGVVLVEGETDAAFLQGLADRQSGLDAAGIAVVPTSGKGNLSLPLVILEELGVPTFVIFDGDSGVKDRLLEAKKSKTAVRSAVNQSTRYNRNLLRLLGEPLEDFPPTRMSRNYAVFHDRLEEELERWPGFCSRRDELKEQTGDWRGKPDDIYRQAALEAKDKPPPILMELFSQVLSLAENKESAA